MKLCQHEGCTSPAVVKIGWRVWSSKSQKAKGTDTAATGLLDVAVCMEHVPKEPKEVLTDETKAMVNKAFGDLRMPWPKWSTVELITHPL